MQQNNDKRKDQFKLTSIDEHGARINIIPAEVQGYFRKHRTRVQIGLLLVFLGLPWIHFQGHQLVLLNIQSREFIFFGLIFKSHDAPLIFLLLAILTLGLALVTSIWGRIWCGWACPQTVFIDAVYRKIEIWTEGKYIERRKLNLESWSFLKFRKKTFKWILFFLVSTLFAHSFVAYFTGSIELLKMINGSPTDNWNYFLLVMAFTAVLLFNFAWFREQFCIIMCPYGRIQSVLMEPSSLAIVYDQKRGEPRRDFKNLGRNTGDCVGCNRCVEVCPTGIDIRNGLQMECISCTACVDACDEIMKKVKKPRGLISYSSLDNSSFQFWRLKTYAYGSLILMASGVLAFNLATREPVEITLLRGIDSPFSQDLDAAGTIQIINHFRIHLTSQIDKDISYYIALTDADQKPKDEDLNKLVELFSGVTLKGSVDGYYLYNSNNPAVNTATPTAADSKSQNKYRVFDLYHDDLQISYAHLQIQKTISQLSTTLDFGYGPAMQVLSGTKTDAAQINMNQAYVGYKLLESLKIEVGRFYTHIGFEVAETQDDWNYSRGLLCGYFQPAWHQGVKATYSINDKLSVMALVADGWNNSYVNSRQKSYGTQINWNPTDSLSFYLNTMGGTSTLPTNLDAGNTVQNRNLYDFIASYKVNDKLSFAINFDSYVHGIYSATGTAVYSKYQFSKKWAVSPRYEVADDKDNLIFGESFTDGQKLTSFTLTIENRINANLILRLEGRQDKSNRETFQKDGVGVESQSTGTLGFVTNF